ncbi:hypothetical protein COO60DRAFT_1708573 [Scenedesmus sp. NREL 46B-D3]|nr:hypothetical protein COO60DRAFT_1708573 [Scenedesmus sp. NREL 46B-D3]
MLRSHTMAEKNVMLGLHCAQLWEEEQQLEQLVLLETQVAARLAAAKAGTSYRGSSSSHPRSFSQQATAPRPAAPRPMPQQQDPCRFCKGGHPSSACYYDKPNRAARWWTPSNPDPELQRHYRARCQELGTESQSCSKVRASHSSVTDACQRWEQQPCFMDWQQLPSRRQLERTSRTSYPDPAFCPIIKTKRGSFRPNKGVADSGCVPDLIFSGQAKDAGLYIHLFAEDEKPKVLNMRALARHA